MRMIHLLSFALALAMSVGCNRQVVVERPTNQPAEEETPSPLEIAGEATFEVWDLPNQHQLGPWDEHEITDEDMERREAILFDLIRHALTIVERIEHAAHEVGDEQAISAVASVRSEAENDLQMLTEWQPEYGREVFIRFVQVESTFYELASELTEVSVLVAESQAARSTDNPRLSSEGRCWAARLRAYPAWREVRILLYIREEGGSRALNRVRHLQAALTLVLPIARRAADALDRFEAAATAGRPSRQLLEETARILRTVARSIISAGWDAHIPTVDRLLELADAFGDGSMDSNVAQARQLLQIGSIKTAHNVVLCSPV